LGGNALKKRYDEELAKSAFTKFLNMRPEQLRIKWDTVPQKFEPPDYYLFIEENRYAVEVTGITETIELNGKIYGSIGVSNSLRRFANEIEKVANRKGILAGTYVIGLSPLSDFRVRREELQLKLLEYIEQTQNIRETKLEKIVDCGFEQIDIMKLDNPENIIETVISYTPKWKGESIEELRSMLNHSLKVKTQKLSKISDPIILIILDSFNYLSVQDWKDIIEQLEVSSRFHTICLVSQQDQPSILISKEKSWISTGVSISSLDRE